MPTQCRLLIILISAVLAGWTPCQASQNRKVTLAAVGDVFFARGVGKQIAEHGVEYPFAKTEAILKRADIAFCNLECPLSKRGLPQRRRFLFRADPLYAGVMRVNGFNVVSLANNHTLDYGRDSMLDTWKCMQDAGIAAVGAGRSRSDALKLRTIRKNGLTIGFIAYTDIRSIGIVRLDDRPTVAGVNMDELASQVKTAKSRCDVLVVSFHWGVEYMKSPTERQMEIARLCVDNGADVILGHHPHVLQPVELYKGKPIIYSMGGFIWDSRAFGSNKSAIYLLELGKSSARLKKVVPVKVNNGQPTPLRQ